MCIRDSYNIKNKKIFVIPLGIPIVAEKSKVDLKTSDKKIILFYGFVAPGKGLEELVEAFSYVNMLHPNTLLVIIGGIRSEDLKYFQYLKKIIVEKRLQNRIVFTGFLPKSKLLEYLFSADVIVLPYVETSVLGSSEALAEIASIGKPVIATKTPKFLELLRDGDNSILINPGDVKQLTEAIMKILSDKLLAQRIANNLRRDALARSWEKIGQKTVKVYKDVIGVISNGKSSEKGYL